MGVQAAAHQCLVGGDYEILNRNTTQPNPHFWSAWLWKQLAGTGKLLNNTRVVDHGVNTYTLCMWEEN